MTRRTIQRLAHVRTLMEDCEVNPESLEESVSRLRELMEPFNEDFGRREMREHGEVFVRGLLSDLPRKSTERIAERMNRPRRGLQRFIGEGNWDHRPVTEKLCREVGIEIGTSNGILVFDPYTELDDA